MDQSSNDVPRSVLVVEDEPLIRLAAIALVEDEGFSVFEAENADDAIAILEAHPEIRIVFTDVQMAGSMDGLQLVAFARDRWPPLRFIVVSGDAKPDPANFPEGAHFFTKPYDAATIGRTLHSLI